MLYCGIVVVLILFYWGLLLFLKKNINKMVKRKEHTEKDQVKTMASDTLTSIQTLKVQS